jgi:hypothetical protein
VPPVERAASTEEKRLVGRTGTDRAPFILSDPRSGCSATSSVGSLRRDVATAMYAWDPPESCHSNTRIVSVFKAAPRSTASGHAVRGKRSISVVLAFAIAVERIDG